ncbi:MAG TPA: hypothetical protein VHN18_03645 [Micromonosporaceae bacterium]|nr:hypothetical protein [Micromonosporaceae bacterium]
MADTSIAIMLVTAVLLGAAAVVAAHRRRMARLSVEERARRAARQLARDRRSRRGMSPRGTGDHFGKTKIKKYGDERHEDASGGGGSYSYGSSGSGGGSDSSW